MDGSLVYTGHDDAGIGSFGSMESTFAHSYQRTGSSWRMHFADGPCMRPACINAERKLNDALDANEKWSSSYGELHHETLKYSQELERKVRELVRDDVAATKAKAMSRDGRAVIKQLADIKAEECRTVSFMARRKADLEEQLHSANAQLEHVSLRGGSNDDAKLSSVELRRFGQLVETERSNKNRAVVEMEAMEMELVRERQLALTSEANFKAVLREREELRHRLRCVAEEVCFAAPSNRSYSSQRYGEANSWTAGCEMNGYGVDETG